MNSRIIPNNGQGRPKGALNHATRELKEFWHAFFSSEEYRAGAKQRIAKGDAPNIEAYLLAMVYGKPRENVDVNVQYHSDLTGLSIEELHQAALSCARQLEEAMAVEQAIPAEYWHKQLEEP